MSRTELRPPPSRARVAVAALGTVCLALLGLLVAAPAHAAPAPVTGRFVDQYDDPAAGLAVTLTDPDGAQYSDVTEPDGTFEIVVPGGLVYELEIGQYDALGYAYVPFVEGFLVDVPTDRGDIELTRYDNIEGTITNFDDATMDYVDVSAWYFDGTSWNFTGYSVSTTTGSFVVPAILDDGPYTLHFALDPGSTAPYLDAYLGGVLEPDDATRLDGEGGSALTGVTMELPDAALISGRVTTGGGATPVPGILVAAIGETIPHGAGAVTAADGLYSVRVWPGETYILSALDLSGGTDPYAPMVYDGYYGCTCQFTPVVATPAEPAEDVDFDLTPQSELLFIAGELVDTSIDDGDELADVRVHVQRLVAGVWTDVAMAETDGWGLFEVVVPADDIAYRLVFDDGDRVLRIVEGEVGPASASSGTPAAPGCALETGEADPGWVDEGYLYYVILGLDPDGGCDAPPPPSSPGAQPGPGRSPRALSAGLDVVPSADPTPTPTPTPSTTPRPTATPEPDATDPAEPTAASGPDLLWLVWLGVVLLVVVAGVIVLVVVRRAVRSS